MEKSSKIYVAGHNGLVGSSLVRCLESLGYQNLVLKNKSELDLLDQVEVRSFFEKEQPDYVFLAAAKVGGILANDTYPADFIYDNLLVQCNTIHSAYSTGVKRLLFLGSSCIYPRLAPQPMVEDSLLKGDLEPTNEPYAVAKIAGIKMCEAYNRQYGTQFLSVMPTNLYGPNDNFDLESSHVLPALIRRFHEAKVKKLDKVVIWGTGSPRREFLHVDDMASACVHVMNLSEESVESEFLSRTKPSFVNVGCGTDISIKELAEMISDVTGFNGRLVLDTSKPDGTPRKLLDVSRLDSLGWKAQISLRDGVYSTYEWFQKNYL
jgi:GDP-L-fucose synthase